MSQEEETPQEQDPELVDQATSPEESPADDAAEEAVTSEEVNRPPFALRAGAEISYGTKTGRVKTVRAMEPSLTRSESSGPETGTWSGYCIALSREPTNRDASR